jgi:hypothetical protein
MSRTGLLITVAALVATASTITLARQQTPSGPPSAGSQTTARFYVLNKGAREAVPMVITGVDDTLPPFSVSVANKGLNVTVDNKVSVTGAVTQATQNWEYSQVTVRDEDAPIAAQLLNREGVHGWETTGVSFRSGLSTVILLKRAR